MANTVEISPARLEELERLLEQRTAELRDVKKELEDFNYSVSHDLRAPLRHINGYTKIIMEDYGSTLDPQCLHHFETIQEAARKMAALLEDLTRLSRIGRQELSPQKIALGNLVADVVRPMAHDALPRKMEWKIGPLPEVNCDAPMIKQLFINLLSNAVKFTRRCEQAVIEVGALEENGGTTFFVRDNGIGFDMKYADKLFTIFQRLHAQQEFEGQGAGLAIAKRIINKHGGRIWVEAAVQQGATFYFTLDRCLS